MIFLIILAIFLSMPVLAERIGTISKDGHTINIVDTYSTFDTASNEVTVHLLSCKYSEKFKLDWKPEHGFMKCFPISSDKYYSAPGASLSIKLNDKGEINRVIFSITQIGDTDNHDYQGFSKSWFRNAPIEGLNVKNINSIAFSTSFDIIDNALKVSLNINTVVNETEIGQEITANRFCELYAMPMGTMSFTKYIGTKNGKTHIQLHEMSLSGNKKWSVNKFWSFEKEVKKICSIEKY